MSQQIVFKVIAQLLKEGKTPTTALIKSRLPHPLPMAEILQALTAWRRNPQLAKQAGEDVSAPAKPADASTTTLESLQRRIEQLEQQVAILNQKVSGLGH